MYFVLRRTEFPGGYAIDYQSTLIDQTMTHNEVVAQVAPVRFIINSMVDSFGRVITFNYKTETWAKDGVIRTIPIDGDFIAHRETTGPLESVILPDLSTLVMSYDAVTDLGKDWLLAERLKNVTRYAPNGGDPNNLQIISSEIFHYEKSGQPYALTGITDTANVRYATWGYSDEGLAISSEHAGGVDRVQLDYDVDVYNGVFWRPTVTATNPLGKDTIYRSHAYGKYFSDIEGQASNNCVGDAKNIRITSTSLKTIDREGREMVSQKNTRGWVTSKTEANGTPEQAVMTTEWHPVWKLPTRTLEAGLTTDYSYSSSGKLLDITQTDTSGTGAAPRTWAFTYTADGLNVASIDGPLPGASDTQIFTYAGPRITSITNEIGHITRIAEHNLIGLPERMIDPNGVVTRLDYGLDDRLIRITQDVGGTEAVTAIGYDVVGNVIYVTPPNGAHLQFTYDDARRLRTITNAASETITYGRNNMGGITSTSITGADQAIAYQLTQTLDELNRVIETVTTGPSVTGFSYDKEDNLVAALDPRGGSWSQAFDGLNRVKSETDPLGATTNYVLAAQTDARNPLTQVTDARSAVTNYVRNGFGEVVREVNLEAGTTEYVRDQRGLVTKMTDARGVVTDYSYDAAGRPLSVSYPATPSENVNYTWDISASGGAYAKGQLSSVSEEYGTTDYTYNSLDQMVSMTRTIAGQVYVTGYIYDLAGEILSTTYPSGREVKLTRDAAARIVRIETKGAGEVDYTVIMDAITYTAYGPLTGGVFGDGHSLSIAYDTAYRAVNLSRNHAGGTGLMNIGFQYDANGDILALNDNVRPERSQAFTYDAVSRLKTASGGYGDIGYDYNLVGDRTGRTLDDGTVTEIEDYTYDASFRLDNVSSSLDGIRAFTYEASGQVATDDRAGQLYAYTNNNRGRPVLVTKDGVQVASYTYDDDEQRVVKSLPDGTLVHYSYDSEGRLISETNGTTGDTIREYLWLGLTPIAVIAVNDNEPQPCDEQARIDELTALIADKTARIATKQARIVTLNGKIITKTDKIATKQGKITAKQTRIGELTIRIAELEAILAGVNPNNTGRIANLQARIAAKQAKIIELQTRIGELQADITALQVKITEHQTKIDELTTRIPVLQTQITTHQTELDTLQAACDAAGGGSGTGTGTGEPTLSYLHTDHLGKPQFATDASGATIWDAGGQVTPFGDGINTAAAFAQSLQFPGQYADTETGLSHNHHRTYDPALGRYLQSDPIGLAGGLNRYAYVGGNPVRIADPSGLDFSFKFKDKKIEGGKGHTTLIFQDGAGKCFQYDQGPRGDIGLLSRIWLITGGDVNAKVQISELKDCSELDSGIRFKTTPVQDGKISQCAIKSSDRQNNKPRFLRDKYNVYMNNCSDAAVGVLSCAGVSVPSTISPFPSSFKKKILKSRRGANNAGK